MKKLQLNTTRAFVSGMQGVLFGSAFTLLMVACFMQNYSIAFASVFLWMIYVLSAFIEPKEERKEESKEDAVEKILYSGWRNK